MIGQMDRKQDRDRHHALGSDKTIDQRQADEDIVGEGGGNAGHRRRALVGAEELRGDDVTHGPGHRHAREIGDPQPHRKRTMEIRFGKRPEDQHRHGELEDEFGKRDPCLGLEVAGGHDGPADEDHQEDRQNIEGDVEHFARSYALGCRYQAHIAALWYGKEN